MRRLILSIFLLIPLVLITNNVFADDFSSPNWLKTVSIWWVNDEISDNEFVGAIEFLVKDEIIAIPESHKENLADLPYWLANNAGWWSARVLTNSSFESFDTGYSVETTSTDCGEESRNGIFLQRIWNETNCIVTTNNYGLRGVDFEREKPSNTYRIFTVGGSTTYGGGVNDHETWPFYLQQEFNRLNLLTNVEVINAGIMSAETNQELEIIRERLIEFEPDLIVMYDGWNDAIHLTVNETVENWKSVCKLGNKNGFDTVIIVQPLVGSGQRIHTNQELTAEFARENNKLVKYDNLLEKFTSYTNHFDVLNDYCTKTYDYRKIFDFVNKPIFSDYGHAGPLGNEIIANNMIVDLSSIISNKIDIPTNIEQKNYASYSAQHNIYATFSNLSEKNFDGLDLTNAVFDYADLSDTSFTNTNLSSARFVKSDLTNSVFSSVNLSNTNFFGADLSSGIISDSTISGANLSYTNLSGHDLSDKDLTDTILVGANLSNTNLTNVDLSGRDLSFINLSGQDLSDKDLTDTILVGANLSNTNLTNVDLSGRDLTSADLSFTDLSNIDLSGTNLSFTNLLETKFDNTDLSDAVIIDVDFTKIKNNNMKNCKLSGTSFSYSDVSGMDFSGADLSYSFFKRTTAPNTNFNNATTFFGTIFYRSDLSSASFVDVDLSPKEIIFQDTFENKSDLYNLSNIDLAEELWPNDANKKIIFKERQGNDLYVRFFIFNNFENAVLQDSKFTNSNLSGIWLKDTNLQGADLRNVNLFGANLRNADLTNADLAGVNIDSAVLDDAILKCSNHDICN